MNIPYLKKWPNLRLLLTCNRTTVKGLGQWNKYQRKTLKKQAEAHGMID